MRRSPLRPETDRSSPGSAPTRGAVVRTELGRWAELAALIGFAVAQPVLGTFGESPETFVSAGARSRDIVVFALVVVIVPLLGVGAVSSSSLLAGPRVRRAVQHALVGLLVAIVVSTLVREVVAGPALRVLVALTVGVGAAYAHRRWTPVSLFLRYASPTPVLIVGAFLFASPVAPLVRPPAPAAPDRAEGDHPPVVLIVLDELPTLSLVDDDGGIDAELFPNIARLAATSTWYRDHTTVSSVTTQALPALVTGRRPDAAGGGPPLHTSHPDSVFTLLGATHEVRATEWVTALCPESVCDRATPSITPEAQALVDIRAGTPSPPLPVLFDDARSIWWEQVWPDPPEPTDPFTVAGVREPGEIVRPGLEFLSGLDEAPADRPVFDYLHLPLPHQPWILLPDGRHHAPDDQLGLVFHDQTLAGVGWPSDDVGDQLAQATRARHLLQMQWVDHYLGAVFDRLRELDRWDEAVVVLTADHGLGFTPGEPIRSLTAGNQLDVGWVPLLVKAPGQRDGAVVDDGAEIIDVLPTIAGLAGVTPSWEVDGRDLLDPAAPDPPTKLGVTPFADTFASVDRDGRVALDADGLAAIDDAARTGGTATDLRAWRHGRHQDLVGRTVDDLGVCGPGPAADRELPPGWSRHVDGRLAGDDPRPLHLTGRVDTDETIDVAASVDGIVAGWAVTIPRADHAFTVLLTEPLVRSPDTDPVLHQVVDEPGCRLRPLAT